MESKEREVYLKHFKAVEGKRKSEGLKHFRAVEGKRKSEGRIMMLHKHF